MKHKLFLLGAFLLMTAMPFVGTGCEKNQDLYEEDESSSSSSSSYTFDHSSSGIMLTVVQSKLSKKSSKSVDVYKKGSKKYIKIGSKYYTAHSNSYSSYVGVKVSSYKYYSLKVSGSTDYYYFYN